MPYAISHDAATRLLTLRISGFWTDDTADDFEADIVALSARLAHLSKRGGRVLIDATGFQVQAPAIIARIASMTVAVSETVDRFALVGSGSALQRRQIERVLPTDRFKVFDDRDVAIQWLDEAKPGLSRAPSHLEMSIVD